MTIAKPPYGSPCNSCGACCRDQLCPLARLAFPTWRAPCPALAEHEQGFACGFIVRPRDFAPVQSAIHGARALSAGAALLIGAGRGCDAARDEPVDPDVAARLRAAAAATPAKSIARAMHVWGVFK